MIHTDWTNGVRATVAVLLMKTPRKLSKGISEQILVVIIPDHVPIACMSSDVIIFAPLHFPRIFMSKSVSYYYF
jgi:hypothetical protein